MLTFPPPVYTCQKPQHKRCKFFLWQEDAKPREESAVLANSRNEAVTPTKHSRGRTSDLYPSLSSALKPALNSRHTASSPTRNLSSLAPLPADDDGDDFGPLSDNDLSHAASQVLSQTIMPPPETPRKAVKTVNSMSPGKRKLDAGLTTPTSGHKQSGRDDVFVTPSTGTRTKTISSPAHLAGGGPQSSGLLSPAETPTASRVYDTFGTTIATGGASRPTSHLVNNASGLLSSPSAPRQSELADELLDHLRDMNMELTAEAVECVKTVSWRHELKKKGIERGRDISRAALRGKDVEITRLKQRVAALEQERETSKTIIRALRKDSVGE
jgi:hypothetical protein